MWLKFSRIQHLNTSPPTDITKGRNLSRMKSLPNCANAARSNGRKLVSLGRALFTQKCVVLRKLFANMFKFVELELKDRLFKKETSSSNSKITAGFGSPSNAMNAENSSVMIVYNHKPIRHPGSFPPTF